MHTMNMTHGHPMQMNQTIEGSMSMTMSE